jgi:sec-independent protein translocase protein TatA
MGPSWIHLLAVGVVALVLFGGKGRISSTMGDLAKGITAFRKGLKDDTNSKEELVNVTPKKDETPSS